MVSKAFNNGKTNGHGFISEINAKIICYPRIETLTLNSSEQWFNYWIK